MIGIRQSHYLVHHLTLLRKVAKNISESGLDAVSKDLGGCEKRPGCGNTSLSLCSKSEC